MPTTSPILLVGSYQAAQEYTARKHWRPEMWRHVFRREEVLGLDSTTVAVLLHDWKEKAEPGILAELSRRGIRFKHAERHRPSIRPRRPRQFPETPCNGKF